MAKLIDVDATQNALEQALADWLKREGISPKRIMVGLTSWDEYYQFVVEFTFGAAQLFWDGAESELTINDTAYHPDYLEIVISDLELALQTWRLLRGQ